MAARPDIGRLRRIPRAELVRMLSESPVPEPWRMVQELRASAVPYYGTDTSEARAIAARAVELAEILQDDRSRGWGYRALAEALAYSGRIRESEEAYQEAAAAFRRARDGATLGQLLVGRIQVLSLMGRHDAVRRMAAEARRSLAAAGDDAYLARLSVSLGNIHFLRDEYDLALAEYDRALALLPDRDELAVSLGLNRAVALTNVGREEEGLALYDQLEAESRERGLDLFHAQIQMNAAHVHVQRGEFDRALARLAPAVQYFREIGHPTFLATSQLHRAEAYQQMNLRREALELAEESAQIFRGEGLGYDEALSHGQVAIAQLATGRPDDALRRLRRSRRLFEIEQNRSRVALTRLLWAESLYQKRRFRDATHHVDAALETFRELRLVRWEAAAAVLRTHIVLRTHPARPGSSGSPRGKKIPASRATLLKEQVTGLRKLLRRLSPAIYPLQTYRLWEVLGEILELQGRTREAERSYRAAVERLEDLRLHVPTEDSKIAFLEDKFYLYDRLLAIELGRPAPAPKRILEWMERSRAQSLWDRLNHRPTGPGQPAAESSEIDRLRAHLYWLHARVSQLELGSDQERAQADALRRQLLEVEVEWARRLREDREAAPRKHAAEQMPVLTDSIGALVDQVQTSLPEDWGYLSYHVGRDFAVVVAVTSEDARVCLLDPDLGPKLQRLCARLDFQWGAAALCSVRGAQGPAHPVSSNGTNGASSRPGAAATSPRFDMLLRTTEGILAELHDLLWAPLERIGLDRQKGWVISPHGPIHRVPMHALRGPEGYLVESYDLLITPNARVWERMARRKNDADGTTTAKKAWIGGVPSSHLPAVEREIREVGRILGDRAPVTVLAPTTQMFQEQANGARLIHLAAHGSLRKDNPAFSFVQLADGPLFVHDLIDLNLPGSEVVLTACSSGRAAAPAGDEWIGLARGFLQAGASSVVASLWPIEDGPTLELMELYYSRISAGDPPAAALGSAMRVFMKHRPHPWHWAAFAVLGGPTGPSRSAVDRRGGGRKRGQR